MGKVGTGWVCENHPKRARIEEIGCQCGAGMPCECVRPGRHVDAGSEAEIFVGRRTTRWLRLYGRLGILLRDSQTGVDRVA